MLGVSMMPLSKPSPILFLLLLLLFHEAVIFSFRPLIELAFLPLFDAVGDPRLAI